jgi:hypothetical protein
MNYRFVSCLRAQIALVRTQNYHLPSGAINSASHLSRLTLSIRHAADINIRDRNIRSKQYSIKKMSEKKSTRGVPVSLTGLLSQRCVIAPHLVYPNVSSC